MTSRQTALAGALFGPAFGAALLLVSPPDGGDSDAAFTRFYADQGHRTSFLVGGVLMGIAALAWIVFSIGLRARAGDGTPGRIASGASLVGAALMCAGAALVMAVPGSISINHAPVPDPDLLRLVVFAGYTTLTVFAMPAVAVGLVAAMAGGLGEELLPRPLAWTAFAVAALLLLSVAWFPMLLLALWAVAAAVVLARRPLRIPVA